MDNVELSGISLNKTTPEKCVIKTKHFCELVRQQTHVSITPHSVLSISDAFLDQSRKDLSREQVELNGVDFSAKDGRGGNVDRLQECLLEIFPEEATKLVLSACSRTNIGGDVYSWLLENIGSNVLITMANNSSQGVKITTQIQDSELVCDVRMSHEFSLYWMDQVDRQREGVSLGVVSVDVKQQVFWNQKEQSTRFTHG